MYNGNIIYYIKNTILYRRDNNTTKDKNTTKHITYEFCLRFYYYR